MCKLCIPFRYLYVYYGVEKENEGNNNKINKKQRIKKVAEKKEKNRVDEWHELS